MADLDRPAADGDEPRERRRRLVRWGILAGLTASLLGLGFYLDQVANPLLIGLLLAYILNPVVEALERRGLRRGRSVGLLFGLVLVILGGTTIFGAVQAADGLDQLRHAVAGERLLDPRDADDARRIAAHGDQAVRDGGHWYLDEDGDGKRRVGLAERGMNALAERLGGRVSRADLLAMARAYQSQLTSLLVAGVEVGEGLRRSLSQLGTFFGYVLLVPLYTFFLLRSFSAIRDGLRDHLPGAYRARIVDLARKIDRQVAAFFRGKIILAGLKGAVTAAALAVAGVPFPLFIGLLAGALSVVPLLGPLCGGALAIALSFDAPDGAGGRLAGVAVAFLLAEVAEAVAQPVILGREVGLSPLALILALFVFGSLLGMFGVLLAVPIACTVKILFAELVLPEIRALAAEPGPPDDDPAAGPGPAGPGLAPPAPRPAVPTLAAPAAPGTGVAGSPPVA